jgi:hypothetical protein
MKFQYYTGDNYTIDPFVDSLYYSLGKLDNYNFRRNKKLSSKNSEFVADYFLKTRIHQLRNKYKYIRLWFSGGKDSTLALESAIKYQVHIDEIVIVKRTCERGPNLYPEYAQSNEINEAIKYINNVKHLIPDTKISIVTIDDPHHESILENPDWYTKTTEWFFCMSYSMNMFYRYTNPKFNILEDVPDRCDLCGAAVPSVFYNNEINRWQFNFVDAVFVTAHGGFAANTVFEDFLITEDYPQLLEFFVNSIANDIIKQYDETGVFDVDSNLHPNMHPGEYQRLTRDRSPLYRSLQNFKNFQFNKGLEGVTIEIPSDHIVWSVDPQPKSRYELLNRYYQNPVPKCFDLYANVTPWHLIMPKMKNRQFTKTWTLN